MCLHFKSTRQGNNFLLDFRGKQTFVCSYIRSVYLHSSLVVGPLCEIKTESLKVIKTFDNKLTVKPTFSLFLNLVDGLHYGADGAYEVVGHHCQAVWAFARRGPHLSSLWVPPSWGPRTVGHRQSTFNHSLQANVQHDPQVDIRRYLGRPLY